MNSEHVLSVPIFDSHLPLILRNDLRHAPFQAPLLGFCTDPFSSPLALDVSFSALKAGPRHRPSTGTTDIITE